MLFGEIHHINRVRISILLAAIWGASLVAGPEAAARSAATVSRAPLTVKHGSKPRVSIRQRMKATVGRVKANVQRLKRSKLGQFAAGLFIDGPVETWQAIRANPKTFVVGLCLTAACALAGDLAGVSTHGLLVGASGVAAGAKVAQIYRDEYRAAKTGRSRIAGKMAWLPALVVATALAGGMVATDHHAGPMTMAEISRSMASGIVTGGDLPTASVTTFQGWKEHQRK